MENEKDKLYQKIDGISVEISDLKIGFAKIETMLSEGYLRRLEILEKKQDEYEGEQKSKNRWIWSIILPLIIKQIYDLIITVS